MPFLRFNDLNFENNPYSSMLYLVNGASTLLAVNAVDEHIKLQHRNNYAVVFVGVVAKRMPLKRKGLQDKISEGNFTAYLPGSMLILK